MKTQLRFAFLLLCAGSLALPPQAANACSFDTEPYFTYSSHPDLPLDKYAAGQLGTLQSQYARSYLIAAYRYLSGRPLSAAEQQAFLQLWNKRLTDTFFECKADTSAWTKVRDTVPGAKKLPEIILERPIGGDQQYETYCNCQTNAFQTAGDTLKGLIDKYGASSAEVKSWLDAQDQVFSDCGYSRWVERTVPSAIPESLPASAAAPLQKDRAYQIAAANFYSQNLDQARQQFDAVAADKDSPWHALAGYLSVRALIRQATLPKQLDQDKLAQAGAKLKTLAADPDYAQMLPDIKALQDLVAARGDAESYMQACLASPITTQNLDDITTTIDNMLGYNGYDYTLAKDRSDAGQFKYASLPASVKSPEMLDWVMTFQSYDDSAKSHAWQRWHETHAAPWLVAVAGLTGPKDADADQVMAEIRTIKSGPAYWGLFSDMVRLQLGKDRKDEARAELDKVISAPPADLPAGALNALRTQRLSVARNLAEIIKFGVQTPLSICSNGGVQEVPDEVADIIKTGKLKPETPEFTLEAGKILDSTLPLNLLRELAANPQLPTDLRNDVGWSAWVRAVLIGDDREAMQLAGVIRLFNKAKTKYFDSYLASTNDEDRKFASAFLMLHFSSAQPIPMNGPLMFDGYGDAAGWWWGAHPYVVVKDEAIQYPSFLTKQQIALVQQQTEKLTKIAGAPNYLGNIVLAFAKTHPNDPRIPEALHLTVNATHYGATDDETQKLSQAAFKLLHTKYPTNPWVKKTPYWY